MGNSVRSSSSDGDPSVPLIRCPPRPVPSPLRFRFADFVVSPRQRLLLRRGQVVPLIPKYFDLLLLLIGNRPDAVSKEAIFAAVWADVIVSDGALSQAIRTLRRTLGDDVRDPRFIRTVSRHGYQFVYVEVIEEDDDALVRPTLAAPTIQTEPVTPLVEQLLTATDPEEARDLAERLHGLGTASAIENLTARPHHGPAIALMRDTRWTVPDAGDVPLLADTEATSAIVALVRLRLLDVKRVMARRWASAALAGGVGGSVAGLIGGIALVLAPMSTAHPRSSIALATLGALAGVIGAGGVAAGVIVAEVLARSRRVVALVACAGASGATVATAASIVLHALLNGLVGVQLAHSSGAIEGLVLGACAGLGYGVATPHPNGSGLAAPQGWRRAGVVTMAAGCCAAGAIGLGLAGLPLVGGLVHAIARASRDAELVLTPLGSLIGDPGFGLRTQTLLSAFEGAMFGGSLAAGLTRRPAIG